MPGIFKNKEASAPATKLTAVWLTLTPVVQGYFEKLYADMPERVSEVLCGQKLERDDRHPTLESWVNTVHTEEKPLFVGEMAVGFDQLLIEPDRPEPGQKFKVKWTGSVGDDFPARKDRLQIRDLQHVVLVEKVVDQPEAAKGRIEVSVDLDGLPTGAYLLDLCLNCEGTDGTLLSDQGVQSQTVAQLFVGQTRDSQIADDYPKIAEAAAVVTAISSSTEFDKQVQESLLRAANLLLEVDMLGDYVRQQLRTAVDWAGWGTLRQSSQGEYTSWSQSWIDTTPGWNTIRDRLVGSALGASADSCAEFADTLADVMNDFEHVPPDR